MKYLILVSLLLVAGCGLVANKFVGNSPMERQHRKVLQQEQETFDRQKYERRYAPAVEETEVFFSFTNRLSQRDTEPMDLVALGKLFVNEYGSNVTWQVVTAAFKDYSNGADLLYATNTFWLVSQSARTRDTAWMINFQKEWMP